MRALPVIAAILVAFVAGTLLLPPATYIASALEEPLENVILDPSKYVRFEWSELGSSVNPLRVPR